MSRRQQNPLELPLRGWAEALYCREPDGKVRLTDRSRSRALAMWALLGVYALLLAPLLVVSVAALLAPPARPAPASGPGAVIGGSLILAGGFTLVWFVLMVIFRLHHRFTVVVDASYRVVTVRSRLFGLTRRRVEVTLDRADWDVAAVTRPAPGAAVPGLLAIGLIVLSIVAGPIGWLLIVWLRGRRSLAAEAGAGDGVALVLTEDGEPRAVVTTADEPAATRFLAACDRLGGR